ncbi:nickel ABC transporter permease subunit NikB [Malaciobacter mytili LMG 24559]|uniref:Nickel ABC transporter permease subunit NikB n=1 Tax=Malaciobacter mytili LMG 24559 TaxID=1032238 RepID=A0AAX2AJZ5_9BACT|nr:nickel/cobalt ABC transporter permease [Malaciobacter mytili]AXH14312.1 nickel ABC transporter, permease protein [Malaciobacter mytili LMG 24559]RXK16534.1 nickel ABC transporter permease subunit NikB [Malaciobacter mytili LMG 24559]
MSFLKQLFLFFIFLIAISLVCFILVNLSPNDPAEVALRVNDVVPTNEAIKQMREELGLDKPLFIRYFDWLKDISKADFGISYITKTSVNEELLKALPTTFYLSLFSLFLIISLGLSFGILCAIFEGSLFDKILRAITFVSMATPSFWLGLLLIWIFALHFNLFPTGGFESFSSIILPSITLAFHNTATFVRLIRNSLIENRETMFIYYAKARGLKKVLILKHQIKNALPTFLVALAMSIPKLLAGTVIVENIFGLPGLGRLCIEAIFNRDYPIIQAYVLFMAVLFIFFNFITDAYIKLTDPRLKEVR